MPRATRLPLELLNGLRAHRLQHEQAYGVRRREGIFHVPLQQSRLTVGEYVDDLLAIDNGVEVFHGLSVLVFGLVFRHVVEIVDSTSAIGRSAHTAGLSRRTHTSMMPIHSYCYEQGRTRRILILVPVLGAGYRTVICSPPP
jgi:hypothetical protein